jgi:hypothetical protein
MPPSPQPPPPDDAYLALTTNGGWINNADTKNGLLATALAALTIAAVKQRPRVEALVDADVDRRGVVAVVLITVAAVFILLAGYWLFQALRPRLGNDTPSRFAFPHLANVDIRDYAGYDAEDVRREALVQAQALAQIGLAKYQRFSKALSCTAVAALAFLGWLLAVPAP